GREPHLFNVGGGGSCHAKRESQCQDRSHGVQPAACSGIWLPPAWRNFTGVCPVQRLNSSPSWLWVPKPLACAISATVMEESSNRAFASAMRARITNWWGAIPVVSLKRREK